ncbi:MAG TPA: peptidylprolyl isomerase [Thermoanaerobaculia bacterium]|nr:peptidylprolyl isomerase [Thermoanaerobaculia bacterium]
MSRGLHPHPPRWLAAPLLLLAAMLSAVALGEGSAEEAAPEVVATWDGGSLARGEYEEWLAVRGLEDGAEAIRELAYVRSMATAAEARGEAAALETRLAVETVRRNVLAGALRRHVEAAVTVGDREVEQTLREHPEAFRKPRRYKLRNIYKTLGSGEQAAATRAAMEGIRERLLAGADFAELAAAESESQTRFRGGNLGFVTVEELPPPVGEVVRGLEAGELSPVVEHAGGLTLLRCEEIREARRPSADERRAKVRTSLLRHHRQQAWAELHRGLWEAAEPKLHPGSKGTMLELAGYRLSAAGVQALLDLRRQGTALADLDREAIEALLTDWGQGVLAVRHAVELGLDRDPEIAATLRWKTVQAAAHRELVHRVDERLERLEPPAEAELRRAFAEAPERYRKPPAYELALVFFPLAEGAAAHQQVARAAEAERRLAAGELTFEQAARQYSDHPSAERGGYLGWIARSQAVNWGPVVSNALKRMKPGERSGLLRNEAGLWIFELRGERQAAAMSFEEAEPLVAEQLRRQRIEVLERQVRSDQLAAIGLRVM